MKDLMHRYAGKPVRMAIALLLGLALMSMIFAGCSGSADSDAMNDSAAAPQAHSAAEPAVSEMSAYSMDQTTIADGESGGASVEQEPGTGGGSDGSGGNRAAGAAGGDGDGAASAGNGGNGGIGAIASVNDGINRKVIYRADAVMRVEDFAASERKLRDAIHLSGGFLLQFNNSYVESERGASYVIKVPASGFSEFLDDLRAIQPDLELQMQGNDVTEEFVDLESRLKAKQVVEARYLAFMDEASGTDALVRFANELARVQEEIEQIKGRMRYLEQNVAYSTVNLRMYEVKEGTPAAKEKSITLADRVADAMKSSATVLRQLGEGLLVFIAALLPVLAIVAVICVPAFYFVRRRRQQHRAAFAEKRKQWNESPDSGLRELSADVASDRAEETNVDNPTSSDRRE